MIHKYICVSIKLIINAIILFSILSIAGCTEKYIYDLNRISVYKLDNVADQFIDNCTIEQTNDYFYKVHKKIEAIWIYPYEAAVGGYEGEALMEFIIIRNGRVKNINILGSSGHDMLDDEAVRAIKRASPFEILPACADNAVMVRGKFIYVHTGIKKQ